MQLYPQHYQYIIGNLLKYSLTLWLAQDKLSTAEKMDYFNKLLTCVSGDDVAVAEYSQQLRMLLLVMNKQWILQHDNDKVDQQKIRYLFNGLNCTNKISVLKKLWDKNRII